MATLGNKVLKVTKFLERQEIKQSPIKNDKNGKLISKIIHLEEIEKKQIKVNAHTLIVINHYFKKAHQLMKKTNDNLYLYGSSTMIIGSYGRQKTKPRLEKLRQLKYHLFSSSKLLDHMVNLLNRIIQLIKHFERYTKKEERETKRVIRYETIIANEHSNLTV